MSIDRAGNAAYMPKRKVKAKELEVSLGDLFTVLA
jgi:hypothetical protein